jgi:hypothetical protein
MTAPDMRIQRVQVALFCRINLEDKLTLAAELRRRNHERFDGEPIMFPPSPGATSGLPAFSLQSKDGNHTLTVSSHRVDAVSQYELASRPVILDAVANEKEFVLDLVATLSESEQVDGDVNRIGVLLSLGADLDDSAVGRIRSVFLAPGVSVGRRRLEIGVVDRLPWQDFEVNRRMRLSMSQRSDTTSGSLELTIDYNTLSGQTHNMDRVWVANFLEQLKARSVEEMEVFNA